MQTNGRVKAVLQVVLVGPHVNSKECLLGNYYGTPAGGVTSFAEAFTVRPMQALGASAAGGWPDRLHQQEHILLGKSDGEEWLCCHNNKVDVQQGLCLAELSIDR